MNMLRFAKMVTVVLVAVVPTSFGPTVAAQNVPRTLTWGATVAGAEALLPVAHTYRLFGDTDEFSLNFTFFNNSSDSLSADLGEFAKGVQFQLRSDRQLPIETQWNSSIHLSDESVDSPAGPIRLPAHTGFGWTVKIRRDDRSAFSSGSYELTVSIADALRSLRENESHAWTGIAAGKMTILHISIAPPASNEERARMYKTSAGAALTEHRPADAVRLFRLALDAMPNDIDGLAGLGQAYLALNRYRDAISAFERVLPVLQGRRSSVPLLLALSHVAIGDEQNAARVLRLEGRSEAAISDEIRRLRDQARRRAAR